MSLAIIKIYPLFLLFSLHPNLRTQVQKKKSRNCFLAKDPFILFDLPKCMILKEACILVQLKERINLILSCSSLALIYFKHQSEHRGRKSAKCMAESAVGAYWDKNDCSLWSWYDQVLCTPKSEFHPEQHFVHRNWKRLWGKGLNHGIDNKAVKRKHLISN